jgi:hypothetical protein
MYQLSREIRKTIGDEYYTDIDLKRAHPSLLLTFAIENNLNVPFIHKHVTLSTNHLSDLFNMGEEEMKKLLFGVYFYPEKKSFKGTKQAVDFQKGICKDILKIYSFLESNKKLYKELFDYNDEKNTKKWNKKGSLISWFSQTLERIIIMSVLEELSVLYPYTSLTCLIHDGFLLFDPEKGNSMSIINDVLHYLNTYLKTNFCSFLKLEMKEFESKNYLEKPTNSIRQNNIPFYNNVYYDILMKEYIIDRSRRNKSLESLTKDLVNRSRL